MQRVSGTDMRQAETLIGLERLAARRNYRRRTRQPAFGAGEEIAHRAAVSGLCHSNVHTKIPYAASSNWV